MSIKTILSSLFILTMTSSCLAIKIVDTAIDTTVGVTTAAAKTTGKVAGAVIPGGKEEQEERQIE